MLRWAELSMFPEEKRYRALSAQLNTAGLANEVAFITTDGTGFTEALKEAQSQFGQLRFGGSLGTLLYASADRMSALMLALRTADAYVQRSGNGMPVRTSDGLSGTTWWPKNFLTEGIRRALVADLKALDFSGAVFVLGAGAETRSAVAALARIGFNRFGVSDPNESLGRAFVEEAQKTFFNSQFQFVPRHLITQLPSVHSVAINTLVRGRDAGALDELFYFNFLKPGGLWLDLSFESNNDLESEAVAVGAKIEPGLRVAAWTDVEWALETLGLTLSIEALVESYKNA